MSQSPVREAITTLVAQAILEHQPNVGTHVKSCTREETIETYEGREAFEVFAASQSMQKSKIDLSAIKDSYENMLQAAEMKDIKAFVTYDQAFHTALLQATENTLLTDLWTQLYARSAVQTVSSEYNDDLKEIALMHYPMIEALESGNSQKLIDAIKLHYQSIIKNL